MKISKIISCCVLGLLAAFAAAASYAEDVKVRGLVEKKDVFVGEGFVFRIEVSGSDSPEAPVFPESKDLDVQFLGGKSNSSQSVTIINGRVSRVVRRGYVFDWRVTARRSGEITIPSVEVKIGAASYATAPITIRAREPAEIEDFKLRLKLSKGKIYVGEPITLTVTFYIGKNLQNVNFNVPILGDDNFGYADPELNTGDGRSYYRIQLDEGEVIAVKGRGKLEGREYTTLSFRKILIPLKAGEYSFPKATVAFEALVGRRQRPGLFDDFFDEDFFGVMRGVYKGFVIPSNTLSLEVKELPLEGRPANFTGLVGEYRIAASAAPTEVNVGDPITLTIKISGPEYLKNIQPPALNEQEDFARDFKIPEEMASGKIEGGEIVFTQTIRAKRANVKEIPAIELSYFDTESGSYRVARTDEIALVVNETRVVTAADAEGAASEAAKTELEVFAGGIAHNYEDLGLLENQAMELAAVLHNPLWVTVTAGTFFAYIILFISTTFMRRRNADPAAREAKKAYGEAARSLKVLRRKGGSPSELCGPVLEALRTYLGKKLRMPAGAITFGDIAGQMREKNVAKATLDNLKKLFEECEAGHYSAGTSEGGSSIPQRALEVVREIERNLR